MHVALLVICAFDERKNAATRTMVVALSIVAEGDDGGQEGSVEPGGLGEERTAFDISFIRAPIAVLAPIFVWQCFPFSAMVKAHNRA